MDFNVMIRVRVNSVGIDHLEEFDYEVPVAMPFEQMLVEIVEAHSLDAALLWSLWVEGEKDIKMDYSLESLRRWDDTVIVLNSSDANNHLYPVSGSITINRMPTAGMH
ncbi:hypothetical protein LARV_00934 [Longilinea arvoryzae]|uniref:Uncharacterized protein n=1 Tax=Longilinea arvoryzae TaxID=360412 RepID=A0A0S7B793_9CHLR|nr:hypothetical protein [Longilinea arvoryzae]GAP13183.1 hypothetical protein LARV_00934 [Longilinea arvoryzae]